MEIYNREDRFIDDLNEVHFTKTNKTIIIDSFTGVNYLFVQSGQSGGLSVLVNQDGKPIVTPVHENDEDDEDF